MSERFFSRFRYPASLILKDEMGASDYHPPCSYVSGDSMCHDIIHFGVHFLMHQAAFHSFINNRISHGVREMLLQAGRHPKKLILLLSIENHYIRHLGPCFCKCSRLIKYDCVGLRHSLQVFSAFYCYMEASGLPHSGENRKGHGQLQGARKVNHQNRQCLRHIARQQPDKGGPSKTPWNEGICQSSRISLRRGFQLFRILYHFYNALEPGRTGRFFHTERNFTFLNGCTGIYIHAGFLSHRN